ncbi:MAG: hypothetical protein M1363_06470 [Gammaproteobacteria bacterium]|nr:hypothetical protein [Gammaproteobacteria bacterium]
MAAGRDVLDELAEAQALLEQSAEAYFEQARNYRRKLVKSVAKLPHHEAVDLVLRASELFPYEMYSDNFLKLASRLKVRLPKLASFRLQLVIAARRRELSGHKAEWFLNNKRSAYEFIDKMKVSRPALYADGVQAEAIEFRPQSVIKPLSGAAATGIFLIIDETQIVEVKSGRRLGSYAELRDAMQGLLADRSVAKDQWLHEELIADVNGDQVIPARDLKFYCFYGKVAMILEVNRDNGAKYCEWLPDGTRAETGRYTEVKFDGAGFTAAQMKQVESLSRKIPVPFIRIDFLATEQRFVFGEFTPRPGQFHTFNDEFDLYLGRYYLAAEARLSRLLQKNRDLGV